jgi:RHS repeat-associated protein
VIAWEEKQMGHWQESRPDARKFIKAALAISLLALFVSIAMSVALASGGDNGTVTISPAAVSTLAGSGSNATVDGTGSAASFKTMGGVVVVGGYAYVGTSGAIRKADLSSGSVTTLAGSATQTGCTDSTTPANVRFNQITDLATDGTNLYSAVYCSSSYSVRKTVIATGSTSTVAQVYGAQYLTYGPDGYLYVTGAGVTSSLQRVDPTTGATSTFLSLGDNGYAITSDSTYLWVAGWGSSGYHIFRVTIADKTMWTLAAGNADLGMNALQSTGDYLYGAARTGTLIRRYTKATGAFVNVAGAGAAGYADGTGTDAWVSSVTGIASDGTNLWLADSGNKRFREAVAGTALPSNQDPAATTTVAESPARVSTFAGNATVGNIDGTGTNASFLSTMAGAVVVNGKAYLATQGSVAATIRVVDLSTSVVSTLAGSPTAARACVDSQDPSTVRFSFAGQGSITTDGTYLYTLNGCGGSPNTTIRRTVLATGATSTVANSDKDSGIPVQTGSMTFGADKKLYVQSYNSGQVVRVDPLTGIGTTLATLPCSCVSPLAADGSYVWALVYIGGAQIKIQRITVADGSVVTMATLSANAGSGLVSAGDYLYFVQNPTTSAPYSAIVRMKKSDGTTVSVAGVNTAGYADGIGLDAWFNNVQNIASDGTNLWVEDSGNHRLRKLVAVKQPMDGGGPTRPYETLGGGAIGDHYTGCACGDPVDSGSGDFYVAATDLAIPGRGISLDLEHTYNSLAANNDGPFGFGWTHSYSMKLAADPYAGSSVLNVKQENGSQLSFTWNGSTYTTPSRTLATLVHNQDGTYTFTRHAREKFVFNSSYQLIKEIDLNGYTTTLAYTSGKLSTVTDPAGRTLTFAYGTNGRVSSVTDSANRSVSYTYDTSGNLTDVTDVGSGNWHFTYDSNHLLLTERDPRSHTTTNTYDSARRVLTQTDPMNRQSTWSYTDTSTTFTDPKGNVTVEQFSDGELTSETKGYGTSQAATWTYAYDSGTLGTTLVTDPNNHTWTKTFDSSGNLLTSTDPLNHQTTYTYDSLNDVTSVTDPLNVATTLTYDTAGNLASSSRPLVGTSDHQVTSYSYGDAQHPGDVTAMTDPDNKTWTYGYDSYGNLTSSTDPLGNKTTYGYDTIGRKTSQVSPKGNVTGGTPADYTTNFVYNAFGDLTSSTDPLGHQTQKSYDADRNLTSLTDANNHQATYSYDADNELTTVTRPDTTTLGYGYDADGNRTSQTDAANHTTSYAFDALNRQGSVTDPLNRTTSYGYDGAGNRTTLTDPANQVTTFGYDAANELTSISYSDGTTPNVSYGYDADGRRTSMTDGAGTTSNSYDSLDRLTSSTNGASATVGYAYDLKGQLTTLTYPGPHNVTRGYDDAGRLTSLSDWLSNTTTYAYDPNGNLLTETYPNGIVASFGYNRADRNLTIEDDLNQSSLFGLTYTRDNLGQLASTTSTRLPGSSESYGYTSLNQLNAVNSGSYSYDAGDNLTSTPTSSSLAYDAANQLTSLTNSLGTTSYSFDSRGNRTSSTDPNQVVTSYSYDQANRLIGFGSAASYAYDGDGLRASKTVSATTTAFTWDMSGSLPLLLQEGTTRYVYGVGGTPLEQVDGSNAVLYYHQDQIGSTRALSDSSGSLQATFTFDAYGSQTGSTGSVSTPFGFAGQYADAESGLQYLRSRYYDPATGQLLSRDPLVSITQSPYGYSGQSPLNAIDPTGMAWGCWGNFCLSDATKGLGNFGAGLGNFVVSTASLGHAHINAPYCGPGLGFSYAMGESTGTVETAIALAAVGGDRAPTNAPRSSPNFEPPTNAPQQPPADIPEGWRIREMPPTPDYPDGYWKLEKPMTDGSWQPIDPSTMKPGTRPETHIPFPPGAH